MSRRLKKVRGRREKQDSRMEKGENTHPEGRGESHTHQDMKGDTLAGTGVENRETH